MAVSVTGPRAVNELGGPVIPGMSQVEIETLVTRVKLDVHFAKIRYPANMRY